MTWKEKLISKTRYLLSILAMCALLVSVSYIFFLRSYDIDVMADTQIVYTGENGLASARIETGPDNLNQRTQDFLDTVVYTITPDEYLANGDTIRITASYDEELAQTYHLNPVNTSITLTVEGLYNRYAALVDIPQDLLDSADQAALSWLRPQSKQLFTSLIRQPVAAGMEMKVTPVCTAFLASDSSENSDKLVYMYRLDFNNVTETYTTYYLVTIPNINDSRQIDEANIYGEKAYLSDQEIAKEAYSDYIERVYGSKYRVDFLYIREPEKTQQEPDEETESKEPEETQDTAEEESESG